MKKISVVVSPPDGRLKLEDILNLMIATSNLAKVLPSDEEFYNQILTGVGSYSSTSPHMNYDDKRMKFNLEETSTKGLGLKGTLQRANGSTYEGTPIPAISAPGSVGTYGGQLIKQYNANDPDSIKREYHTQFAEMLAEPARDYWPLILEFFSQRLDQLSLPNKK